MHETPLAKITLNRMQKHVSDEGQTVIGTCENGSLKYHKYQNVEKETSRNMVIRRRNRSREKPEVDKDSDKSTETFHCVYEAKKK